MRPSRFEILFVLLGTGLGLLAALALQAGWLGDSRAFAPFMVVLIGLGLVEVALAYLLSLPPGALVRMPMRLAAFAGGLGTLFLVAGRIA